MAGMVCGDRYRNRNAKSAVSKDSETSKCLVSGQHDSRVVMQAAHGMIEKVGVPSHANHARRRAEALMVATALFHMTIFAGMQGASAPGIRPILRIVIVRRVYPLGFPRPSKRQRCGTDRFQHT